ncbi:MAG: tetratricopeptide repeat protein [Bacteroidia bacterium]
MKAIQFIFCLILCFGSVTILHSQKADSLSLFTELSKSNTETQKIACHIKIARYFMDRNADVSVIHANKAQQLAEKNNQDLSKAEANYILGEAYYNLEDLDNSSIHFLDALSQYNSLKNDIGIGEAKSGLGKIAYKKGETSASLTHFSEALEIFEKIKYENGLPGLYINIAILYDEQNNFKQAIDFYQKALDAAIKIDDQTSVASAYTNLGGVYGMQGDFKKAIECLEKSIEIKKDSGNKKGLAVAYNNLGATYYQMQDLPKALIQFQKSYDIYIEMDDAIGIFPACNNVGSVLLETGKPKEALPYFEKGYDIALKLNSVSKRVVSLENLTLAYKALGDYTKALDYSIQCSGLKDTLYNKDQAEITTEMQTRFATEKKQQENEILNLQVKSESFIKTIFIIAACLLLAVAFFIFRGLRQKQKANIALEEKNKIIEEQKQTVEHQKHIVEEQNKDITDSIRYAERIQSAILPPEKLWHTLFPQSFVFYKPKDILSGDFYWIEQKGDLVFVAAADCTGHGVPGALISIVNYNLLNKAVLEKDLNNPADILNYVNQQLTVALHQTFQESSVKDGMDIALCVLNTKTLELHYAGANNPIYIIQNMELVQLNADKFPVGAFVDEQVQSFTSKQIQLQKNDLIYLFSDGYADQFGGDKGKKFKYKQLKEVLVENQNLPMKQQLLIIEERFVSWKGKLEQVDDVLVIGIRV